MNIDHLSDWQIEELIIAPSAPIPLGIHSDTRGGIPAGPGSGSGSEGQDQARRHLEYCPLCASKKERLNQTLLLYREAALIETSEAASNRAMAPVPFRAIDAGQTDSSVFFHRLFWGWRARAVAFLLLLVVLVPAFVSRERKHHQAQEFLRSRLLEQQAQAKVAKDDQLLQQVDEEITESVPQPMQSLTQPVLDDGTTGQ